MKAIKILQVVFPLIGVGLLVSATFVYQSRTAFLAEAVYADGVVIDLRRNSNSDGTSYRPVVRFTTAAGEEVQFTSSTGSNPPSYSRGDEVRVFYRPSEPYGAEIDGFFALWGATTVIGGMGAVFLMFGIAMFVATRRDAHREAYLRQHGVPVEAELTRVELNTLVRVNGRNPYRVLAQWQNPGTGKVHEFRSRNVWFDPTSYVTGKQIKVFIVRNDPAKYFVDLSFLPKSAD